MLIAKIALLQLIIVCLSEAIQVEDEDTVIVEAAESENSDFREQRQFNGQFGYPVTWPFGILNVQYPQVQPIQPGVGTCYSSNGNTGQCISLRQCYPALRTIGENDTLVNPGLAEALSSASGFCSTVTPLNQRSQIDNELEVRQTSKICCSSKRPQPPARLQPKPTTTTVATPRQNYRPPFFGHRPPADVSSSPPSFVPSNCGVGHVTGGSETEPSKYPWVVALLNGHKQICGGSLIDNSHVITAAHCVAHMSQFDVAKLRVLLGAHNVYQVSSGTVVKKVSRLVKHRFFNHRTLHNDIALLKLDSATSFTDRIRPICLTDDVSNRYENQVATVAGWGSVGEHSPQPQTLREVQIDIWTNDRCKTKYGYLAPGGIMDHMLCAGSDDRDACRGDSGGPLVIKNTNTNIYQQIGIVSWGIGCGRFPGVYTRITHFLDWIEKNRQ